MCLAASPVAICNVIVKVIENKSILTKLNSYKYKPRNRELFSELSSKFLNKVRLWILVLIPISVLFVYKLKYIKS